MAAPSFFVRSLLRVGALQGRAVLEALVTGQFKSVQEGGLQMLTSATPGQSFSFGVDRDLSVKEIMSTAEEALETFDQLGSAEAVLAFLRRPAVTRARAAFQ